MAMLNNQRVPKNCGNWTQEISKYGQKYGTNVPPFQDPEIPIEYIPDAPWCWNIYLQNWVIFGVVGKYSSTMEHLGMYIYIYISG